MTHHYQNECKLLAWYERISWYVALPDLTNAIIAYDILKLVIIYQKFKFNQAACVLMATSVIGDLITFLGHLFLCSTHNTNPTPSKKKKKNWPTSLFLLVF